MLPPGLSPEEAAVLQQAPRINEAPLNKDPLSALSCSSGLPHVKSSRSSTLSSAEENVFTVSAAAGLPAPPPPGTSHRFLGEREFGQTLHGINGEPADSSSYPVLEDKAQQQQQDGAAASPSVSGDPGDRYSPDSLPTSSVVAPEARSVSPPLVATFGSPATREKFSACTREPGGAALQGYRTELFSPPSVQRNPPSVDSAGERKSDISPRGEDRGTTGGAAATAALFAGTPASASADSFPQPAAAADPKRAPLAAAQPRAAADVVGEEVHRSASAGKTETYSRTERTEELHGAAAISPASVSPRKQKGGGPQGGRSVKEENAMEVITRLDVAVEALVAHAEEQAEQIKKLTMLVEDLSVKLEGLQEGLLSGRVSVHLAPPAPAELPPAAGATEVRQSRGRMVPPPLPRDKVREPRLGAADQQGLPPHSRQGSNAACERSTISASYLAAQREADIEALERRRIEEQREAQRREEERLRREEEERRRREELTRRAAEEQRRREALDEKRKNIISSLISNKGGSSLFGDDGGAASHRSLFDD